MAWIPLYLERDDVNLLNNWLNENDEIAFLISNGPGKWIAKLQHNILSDNNTQTIGTRLFGEGLDFVIPNFIQYILWHIPSGKLPLLGYDYRTPDSFIDDPWIGWTENRQGANHRIPYFGSRHHGIIILTINLADKQGEIPMSDFQWSRGLGNGAYKSAELFWNKLRRMLKKVAIYIPRSNDLERKNEVFAFPSAYKEIMGGRLCSLH